MSEQRAQSVVDGVTLALLTKRFEGVVRKMTNTLFRTARSGVINSARDFSCCILTADAELLVAAESLPIHVMSGPDLIARTMKELHPVLRAGDAFLHNSPYHGNSHAADHCMVAPVVDSEGEHRFTVLVKAHLADCGNASPTSYSPTARDVYEEAALIFPCVRIQEDYQHREDVVRMCKARIRVPELWWGDYLGLLGSVRIGERELLALGGEVGWDALDAYVDAWFDYSERRMIAAIQRLPSGRVTARTAHDPFPGTPEDGVPITASVEVDASAATVEVDLRNNPDCLPCGLNLTEATARTAAMIGIFNSIGHGVPPNAGSFRRARVHLRENCVAGIPRHPASCSLATTGVADRVANAVQRAFSELDEGVGLAEAGLCIPIGSAVISGLEPGSDEPFVDMLILGQTGGPGAPGMDGWLNLAHVGNAGLMLRDSTEIDELRHPIRVVTDRIHPDTEGAGRYRGAPSAYVEYGPVGGSIEVMWCSDGSVNPAAGTLGGTPGGTARQYKRSRSGELSELAPWGRITLEPGETVVSISSGGGGFGPPYEREEERVLHDVTEGWVTREAAAARYGVVIDDAGNVDRSATSARRDAMRATEGTPA